MMIDIRAYYNRFVAISSLNKQRFAPMINTGLLATPSGAKRTRTCITTGKSRCCAPAHAANPLGTRIMYQAGIPLRLCVCEPFWSGNDALWLYPRLSNRIAGEAACARE